MKTSGAETLSSAANIFCWTDEAPLMVKPFIAARPNSELMAIMVGDLPISHRSPGPLYHLAAPYIPDAAGIWRGVFYYRAGSLLVAKLLHPEPPAGNQRGVEFKIQRIEANLVDAARADTEGLDWR